MASENAVYHPVDTLANTLSTTLQTGGAGALIAGVQNTMRKQNVGAMGIITHSGSIIAVFTAVGATFQFTRDAAANLRRKEDFYNDAIGGFFAGNMVGVFRRSLPFMAGAGVAFSAVLGGFRYTEGLRGPRSQASAEEEEDEVERREALRKLRRRPIEETIAELGEGRGIYAPGYEERRRERLLAKYGVDVGPYQMSKS